MKRIKTEIFSIFGQIEEVAANHMVETGRATRIEARDIPLAVQRNERGEAAKFAVIVPGPNIAEFEELIANLRA